MSAFYFDVRLPGQVFRSSPEGARFCSFDAVLTPEFWPALVALARFHGDEAVELSVVEPAPVAVSLPVDATSADWWAVVGWASEGGFAESIAVSAQVIAVTGPSGKWGCWGERDPEVAIFCGVPGAEWCSRFGPFFDVSGALTSILPLTFADRVVPEAYAAELTANYGLPSWRAEGLPDNEIARRLHASGLSLPMSIVAWRTAFGTSLGEAREVVRNAPVWASVKESDEALQGVLVDALEQLARDEPGIERP